MVNRKGDVYSKHSNRLLKWVDTGGYGKITRVQVTLYSIDYRKRNFGVGHLVLTAFVEPCPEGMECCHKNGNYLDNSVDTLCWGTKSDNRCDALHYGTLHHVTHRREETILEIRRLFDSENYTIDQLVEKFNIPRSTISHIVARRTWRHLK